MIIFGILAPITPDYMRRFLKILILEDYPDDVMLIERELEKAHIDFTSRVVKSQEEFEAALSEFGPDIILSDHSLPRFNSIDALRIASEFNKQNNLSIPFILMTGTVSEEFAVQSIKAGAADFILKDRLKRLPTAIMNALEKSANEVEKIRYFKDLIASEGLMRQAEQLAHFGSWHADLLTGVYRWSDETFRIYGYEPGEITPDYETFLGHVHPDDVQRVRDGRKNLIAGPDHYTSEFRIVDRHGNVKYLSSTIIIRRDETQEAVALIGVNLDITERKEAELLVLKSKEEYKSLFDQNPDIVYSLDLDGNFTKGNKSILDLSGITEQELLRLNFKPFIAEEDYPRVLEHFKLAVKGSSQRYRTKAHGKEGKEFILDVTNIPIIVDGKVIGVHGVAKDITERVRLQSLLDKAYELARIGGWDVDMTSKRVTWSRITKELHEVDPDFVPGIEKGVAFYKEGKSRDTIVKALDDALKFGKPLDAELQIVTAKGNLRWVRVIGEAEFKDGKCLRLYGSFQDIHEKKSVEEAKKQADLEKITIFESIGDAFFAVDRKWVVTYWNKVAAAILATPRESIIGRNLWSVFSDAVSLPSYTEYHKAMDTGVPVHFEDFYPPLNRWFEISAYPSAAGLSVYFRDITASKAHVQKIEHQNARLTQIAWTLSHDLRAPLARLMGLIQLVKDYPDQQDLPQTLNLAFKSAGELDDVVRKIVRQTEELGL